MIQIEKVIDPRAGFELFRRKELIEIAKQNGIKCEHDAPARYVRLLLQERNVNPGRYMPQRVGPLHGDVGPQRYEYEKEVKAIIEEINFDDMSFNELRRFCRERGIAYTKKNNREDIMRMIHGHAA